MSILRNILTPTVGLPQDIVAPAPARRRTNNMRQQDFYTAQTQVPSRSLALQQPQDVYQSAQQTREGAPQDQFEPTSNTGDYLSQQLQNYANRAAPPQLDPSGRVKSPNAELVQPSNFKTFYDQLNSITQEGSEQLGAEQARSAFKRLKELQAIQNQQIAAFRGATYQSGQSGGNFTGSVGSGLGGDRAANFRIAQNLARQFGWGPADINAWYTLGMKESGWNNTAQNPTSTAYGIGQFLDSTWGGYGVPKTSDPGKQVLAMARYIKSRYGSPSRALQFHLAHNWY